MHTDTLKSQVANQPIAPSDRRWPKKWFGNTFAKLFSLEKCGSDHKEDVMVRLLVIRQDDLGSSRHSDTATTVSPNTLDLGHDESIKWLKSSWSL